MKTKKKSISAILALILMLSMMLGTMQTTAFAYDPEDCPHTNAYFTESTGEPSCFEPAMGGYWYCEDCYMYLSADKQTMYWDENEVLNAVKKPATGHAFNTDTGECDHCNLANPVYSKVTSLADINEEDMYIFVAKVGDKYFALGGLDESNPDEQDNLWCGASGNAIEIVPNADGSISLLNQNYVGNAKTSEFMFDIDPEQFNSDLDDNYGLLPVMLKLANYCVYPFQSYSLDNTGYMGVPRYGNGVYGMWDVSEWIFDFYTTEVDENTYRDDMDGLTHAEQVARGNIGENISEGDLLMYKASFYSVGGAMFTLRFREYPNPNTGVTEYYFICGEDWALEGSPGWDHVTDTTPTNDTQYAISLYRYDVPSAPAHTCDYGDWVDDENGRSHTRTCKDTTCGKTETKDHNWDDGVQSGTANCLTGVTTTYTCTDHCGATKSETAGGLGHDWGSFTDDGENSTTDTHSRTCKRNCGVAAESESHTWSAWVKEDATNHKKTCSGCNGTRVATHTFGEWTPVGDGTTERRECTEVSCDAYETRTPHVCTFGTWYDTEDGMKHRRDCTATDCNEYEEGDHSFGNFAKIDENFHGHTCSVCNAREKIEHSYYDWADIGESEGHKHECMECEHEVILPHEYTSYYTDNHDGVTHTAMCMCSREKTENHIFGEGVVTKAPTETEEGVKTYTCEKCNGTKTEAMPKLVTNVSNSNAGASVNIPTGGNAYIPEGTLFDVVEAPTNEVPEQVLGDIELKLEGAVKPLACYDLALLLDGAEIQPNGKVLVTLPALQQDFDYDKVVVVYIAPDGSYEECVTTVNEDGTITFETDHFSRYAVIGVSEADANDGLGVGAIIGIIAGAVLLLGGGFALFWFVIKKKSFADLIAVFKKK